MLSLILLGNAALWPTTGVLLGQEAQRQSVGSEPATAATTRVTQVIRETSASGDRIIIPLESGENRSVEASVIPGGLEPRLEIKGAHLSSQVRSREFESGTLASIQVVQMGNTVRITATRKTSGTQNLIREQGRLVWLFPSASNGHNQARGSQVISREDEQGQTQVVASGSSTSDTARVAGFHTTTLPQAARGALGGSTRHHGRRVDLDFNGADIQNILRLLAEVGGVNIISGDDVSGTVTVRMMNVPWDQALQIVLEAKGLGMERHENLIRVAPNSVLEREREMEISRRRQAVELAPVETRLVPISYAKAEDMVARVRETLTTRGTVSLDARTNTMIVRDVAASIDNVERLVQALDTQTPQVLVEARIVEASSNFFRDIGIQWGGDVTMNSLTGNPTGLAFPYNLGVAGGSAGGSTAGLSPFGGAANPNYAVNLPAAAGAGTGGALGISMGSISGLVNVAVRLSAAESSGVVRIVSSPRILTLDNQQAKISTGTSIPFVSASAQGTQVQFQEARLELTVTPHVTNDGSVLMKVNVSRNEADLIRTVQGQPYILRREADTNLLVQDGHTAVIGGIYTRQTGRNTNQVPFFGDIPILGALFQNRTTRDERTEMLIFLTPKIVNRAESSR